MLKITLALILSIKQRAVMRIRSIRVKTTIPMALMVVVFMVCLVLFSDLFKKSNDALNQQADRYLKAVALVINADRDLYQAKVAELNLLNAEGDLSSQKADHDENIQQVKDRFARYEQLMSVHPQLLSTFSGFNSALSQWQKSSNALIASGTQASNYEQQKSAADKQFDAVRSMLDQAGEGAEKASQATANLMRATSSSQQSFIYSVLVIALLIAGFFSYLIPKQLTQQILSLRQRIQEIAAGNGDLRLRIKVTKDDEFGDLSHDFNAFLEKLRQLIFTIKQQSVSLGEVTGHLNQSSTKTEQITLDLGVAADSIVNSGYEMSAANQQMANNASETSNEARLADGFVLQGEAAVSKSHQAISRLVEGIDIALGQSSLLEQSSASIASVLEVIRNIAEQTNLLALNAAIEAARAGEQGRGFAVVADEVRTLATRTQDSTNDIQKMIEQLKNNVVESSSAIADSKSRADQTVGYFDEVDRIFAGLRSSFAKVQAMAAQTAQATEAQSGVATAINRNLDKLNEQTSSAKLIAETCKRQSDQVNQLYLELDNLVGRFKV
ncbi:methyl-accepting chemotaxis protein [Marinomonas hwangdonensis]|uniref:Methyl-accepting chemotaxis protein n=2 Tax=Marinomonas hwangdonensis TaxID=1053647 RepID=A0A3M8QB22_9GAMM|nr:methyl-accepting chemotaxis protein [Marinomonas hwangdonensis]